jgi:hypothetical protein
MDEFQIETQAADLTLGVWFITERSGSRFSQIVTNRRRKAWNRISNWDACSASR